MNDKEILTKAIQKAIDGGWEIADCPLTIEKISNDHTVTLSYWVDYVDEDGNPNEARQYDDWQSSKLIFNHDFAKGLWGDKFVPCYQCQEGLHDIQHSSNWGYLYNWQYHLQQMVAAEDPIKYLGEHLEG